MPIPVVYFVCGVLASFLVLGIFFAGIYIGYKTCEKRIPKKTREG